MPQKGAPLKRKIKTSARFVYTIRHAIPGRVRFYIPAIHKRKALALALEQNLIKQPEIISLKANPRTSSVLINYYPEKSSPQKLIKYFFQLVPTLSPADSEEINLSPVCSCSPAKDKEESHLILPFIGILVTGAILAFSFFSTVLRRGRVSRLAISRLASITAVIAGIPVFQEGLTYMLKKRKLSLDFLVSMAAILAIKMGEGLTALEVIWLMNCGTLLEEFTAEKSRRAITDLIQIGEDSAWVLTDNDVELKVCLDEVKEGDIVCVHIGEKISVDGTIVSGEGSVNQASITGESMPVYKQKDDQVYAGTIVEHGYLQIKTAKVGDDTYLARVIHMVEESLETRAPIESIADKFATIFVPSAFLFSIGVYLVTRNFYRAMTVLVTACPCAAAIATPTAVSAAIGNAARKQILVKGGIFIEETSRIDTLCLDKTGTVTAGKPKVATVISTDTDVTKNEVLAYASAAEIRYSHPLGVAIIDYTKENGIDIPQYAFCKLKTGKGVTAQLKDGVYVATGNHILMRELDTGVDKIDGKIDKLMARGETVVYVAKGNNFNKMKIIGVIGIVDKIRPEAENVISQLRQSGIKEIVLITGDNQKTAQAVSRKLALDAYHCELLPEEKSQIIEGLKREGKEVAMVGDGINDAMALSRAHLGIAMGAGGSELAVETADISLARDELYGLLQVRLLSQQTVAVIKQNYGFSMAMNALGVGLGSLGLISPLMGGILHIMNSLGVILNSSRLLSYKINS